MEGAIKIDQFTDRFHRDTGLCKPYKLFDQWDSIDSAAVQFSLFQTILQTSQHPHH